MAWPESPNGLGAAVSAAEKCQQLNFLRFSVVGDKRGVDLISDVLPLGRLWYDGPNVVSNAVDHAKFYSRSARLTAVENPVKNLVAFTDAM